MEFKETAKYLVLVLAVIGVIGLIIRLIMGDLTFGPLIAADDDFGRLNAPRFVLILWETFWLISIAIFFFYVARRAKSGKDQNQIENLEDVEPLIFKVIIGGLIIAAIGTLLLPALIGPGLPHYRTNADADVEINVVANQYNFLFSGEGCNATTGACVFQVGTTYAFELESADTTHGFAMYDSDNILILQAQIVPGDYVTRLVHTFIDAGEYTVRCAEYCGVGHHNMIYQFSVEE